MMNETQSTTVCRHFRVFGRVQGVWYRGSTRDQALKLGLAGWVRNCDDGSVEAVACGAPEALDELREWLKQGPPAARVDRVEEAEASWPDQDNDFVITP